MSSGVRFFFVFCFTILGGYCGFKLFEYWVTIENHEEIVKNLKEYCQTLQKLYIIRP